MKKIASLLMIAGLAAPMQGCIAAVAAGAIAVDELVEDDGKFDPLEEAYDGDDSTDPILEED